MEYTVHTLDTAPVASRGVMAQFVDAWGFLPHLGGAMAESPAAIELLWVGYGALTSKATLTGAEQQLVSIAVSRENQCAYCVAAHSTLAQTSGLDAAALQAVRNGTPVPQPRLEALRLTVVALVQKRGWLTAAEQHRFTSAGYTPAQLLEVVGWVAVKTLTNYVNHVAATPVDSQWQGQTWTAPAPDHENQA